MPTPQILQDLNSILTVGHLSGANSILMENAQEVQYRAVGNRVFSPSPDVLRIEGNLTTEVGKDGDIPLGVSLTGLNMFPTTDKAFNLGRTGNRFNNAFLGGYLELSGQVDPGAVAANTIRVGSQDATVDAILSTLHLRTEQSAIVDTSFVETHKLAIWHNGTEYYIALEAV